MLYCLFKQLAQTLVTGWESICQGGLGWVEGVRMALSSPLHGWRPSPPAHAHYKMHECWGNWHLGCPLSLFGEASIIKRQVWTKYFPKALSGQKVKVSNVPQACQLSPSRGASWALGCSADLLPGPSLKRVRYIHPCLALCVHMGDLIPLWLGPLLLPDAWSTPLPEL